MVLNSESDLRAWLRRAWDKGGPPLAWTEAAPGGTDGAPDVSLPMGNGWWLPVELKHWAREKIAMRVSQRRFHRLALEGGAKTAFLVLLGGEPMLASGKSVLVGEPDWWVMKRIGASRKELIDCLQCKEFWK